MGSPGVPNFFVQRVVVDVGDMAVSNNLQTVLSTYALGSCIGVVAYDPVTRAGGILHLMLPDSTISPAKALAQPAMFADTGLPRFFSMLAGIRADRNRLRLFVAGGAKVIAGPDQFKIGERNIKATLDYLKRIGYAVQLADIGGNFNRTVHLEIATGEIILKTPIAESKLAIAA
jgi:chemotaxis protein CheD